MVSMPLQETGHCGTSDLGSRSVQSMARGARCALACSLVQRALSSAGRPQGFATLPRHRYVLPDEGQKHWPSPLGWKDNSVPHLLNCALSSVEILFIKDIIHIIPQGKMWRRGRRGVWVSSLRAKGVWRLLRKHCSNSCSETQARVRRVGLTSGRDPW